MRSKLALTASLAALAAQPALAQQGDPVEAIWWYRITNQAAMVRELAELVAIPNVAADRDHIRRNAEHLRGMLARRGFTAEVLETDGNPLVWGELSVPGATRTLLLYCHYDGQPVDPGRWAQGDPWKPVVLAGRLEDGAQEVTDLEGRVTFGEDWRLYARSASDDKGPIVAFLTALDALKAAGLSPTSNLRVIFEGEEEAGSPSLVPAIARYRDKLQADLMLIFDGPQHPSGKPTLVFGARGILTAQLTVYGPTSGVHSGNYGNWVPNPALGLAHLLASMKDEAGNVLVAGFYDGVPALAAEERAMIEAVPDDAARLLSAFGIAGPERPGESLQMALQRPTLNVRGLASAHVGAGARTLIPDRAVAELDIRLIAETPAADLAAKLRAHLERQGYQLVEADPDEATRARHPKLARLAIGRGTAAFRTSPLHPEAQRLRSALERFWEEPPVAIRTAGGTVPIAPFIEALGFPAILLPTVNFDNHQHEENENLRLGNLFDGVITFAAALTM
jgi:acetylornithine deacetylase/succinyl-diaminopimelate desuccinylase-like protein